MRSLPPILSTLFTLSTLLHSTTHAQQFDSSYVCDIPAAGCEYGMFNQDKCQCDCITPFCPDAQGNCIVSGSCADPWADCERGVNCPWWANPTKAEACITGPRVPDGLWEIYNSERVCCNKNFPYSTVCLAPALTSPPTKHPTIARPEDDDYEIVPIKFDVGGLPDNIKMRELRIEMGTVLKRILLRLADRISGLKISNVEEKVMAGRNLLRVMEQRSLTQDVSLFFNVYVVRDEDKKFGPLIISEIRDSYDEVMDQIQTFSDTTYFGGDMDMNICTTRNGKYEICVEEIVKPVAPPARIRGDDADGGGLSGGAVAAIVIFVLLFVCCLGYWLAVLFCGVTNCFLWCCDDEGYNNKETENNIYMDDRSRYTHQQPLAIMPDDRSRRSGKSRQIVMASDNQSRRRYDDDSFTINTRRQGRDPTMYIEGQEDRPDPDSDMLLLTGGDDSSRRYYEDPPLKAKRDPTMYVEGNEYIEDPPLKEKRDPSRFVEGERDPTIYSEGQSVEEVYNDSRRRYDDSMDHIDEDEEYDQFDDQWYRSRDPSYYADESPEEGSFRTQEPSVSGKSTQGRSKKPKKSKRSKGKNPDKLRESLQSNYKFHSESYPDVTDRDADGDGRQTKSFYK